MVIESTNDAVFRELPQPGVFSFQNKFTSPAFMALFSHRFPYHNQHYHTFLSCSEMSSENNRNNR